MTARRLLNLACALVALLAAYRILHADDGIVRMSANVDGIPVEIFAPIPDAGAQATIKYPAVVIAHGYAGSKQVMYELARASVYGIRVSGPLCLMDKLPQPSRGAIAVVFDFTGHGANITPLSSPQRADQLQRDLDRVVRYTRSLPNVDPTRIALIGHSMGASAVVQYAKTHSDIVGVVSISGNATDVTPDAPKNLLLLAGDLEFDSIKMAQRAALANAGGKSDAFSSGRAHDMDFIASSEHLTVLWNNLTMDFAGYWLSNSTYGKYEGEMKCWYMALERPFWLQFLAMGRTIYAAVLLALAAFVLFFPLASFVVSRLGLRAEAPLPAGLAYWQVLLVAVVPAVLAPLILRGLSLTPLDPATWLPIQIVNYLAMHFLLYAVLMLGMLRLFGVRDLWARIRASVRPAALVLAALFLAWIYVTNGVVAHLTWMNFLPSGVTRLWLWPVVFALALPYFVLNEYVTKAATVQRSALNELTSKVALIGSLLFAVALTPGLFFLLLVIAVFAVFFAVYGAYAVHLHQLTGNPLIAALGYAAMTAALLVAVFPITG